MSKRPAEDYHVGMPSKLVRENGLEDQARAGGVRRARDGAGRQVIVYRGDEALPNLQELWRMGGGEETEVEVLIAPEFLAKDNKRVKSRQFWGDLIYTPDSDLVAVLMHLGYYTSTLAHAPQAVVEARAIIKLVPTQPSYPSKHRFVKSRAWNRPCEGCAYKVERFWLVTRSGCIVEMQQCVDDLPAPHPTVQPQSSDRYITTRNTGASKGKQPQDVSVQFNLCNEPWLKYTLAAVADKGLKASQLTSSRLLDQVLFVETASNRYQIARVTSDDNNSKEVYSFSRCNTPLPALAMQRIGLPLPASAVKAIESTLEWEELQWGVTSLHVKGQEYQLKRIHLMRIRKPDASHA